MWLRLLALRDQFRDFDAHFTVERPAGGLALVCRQPVISGEDVSWIVTGPPTMQAEGPPPRWTWRFRKEPIAGDAPELLGRELDMAAELADGMVAKVIFPDAVLKAVPAEVIIAMMRALGTAEIDRDNRVAKAVMTKPAQPLAIPGRAQLLAWFGAPHETRAIAFAVPRTRTVIQDGQSRTESIVEQRPGELLVFRYRLVSSSGVSDDTQPLVTVSFGFLQGVDRPRDFRANLGGNWVTIALPR